MSSPLSKGIIMNRKEFIRKSPQACLGCGLLAMLHHSGISGVEAEESPAEAENRFIRNWMTDLLDTIETECDEATKTKLMAGCGKGCFDRHTFKQDLAEEGRGDVDKLMAALRKNFEIWREGDLVHIRYGETSSHCFCPAAKFRPARPNDMHCLCTRATHQTIWETALGRPFRVDIVETLRRGGETCHFVVHLS